jgi:TolA-binding protein
MDTLRAILVTAVVALAAQAATAQPADADDASAAGLGDEPIAPAAPAGAAESEQLQAYLNSLSEEELEGLIADAATARLEAERREVAAEMAQGLLYDPGEVDAAVERLQADPANTQQDNIRRICEGLASVDFRFAEPYEHFQAGRYGGAADAVRELINPNDASYLSAAEHYVLGRSLAESGQLWPAVDAYTRLVQRMGDKVSFSADAAQRTAALYDDLGRGLYALEAYRLCLESYGLTLSKERHEQIAERVRELERLYRAPLSAAGEMMGDVAERLSKADSGEQTRRKQQEIVALLEDLIKTAEEQAAGGQGGAQGQRQRRQRQSASQREQSGGQRGGNRPSSPMRQSVLPEGELRRPEELSRAYEGGESGDWATLPPRQREKLREAARNAMPERYRDIIRDYRTRLAEQGSQ